MNFFRDKELAERFAADNVSEREKLYYFLATVIIYSLLTSSFITSSADVPVAFTEYIFDILLLVLTVSGSIWIYNINKKGDNKDFIGRYVSLSFPIGIQTLLLAIILFIIIFAGGFLITLNIENFNVSEYGLFSVLIGTMFLSLLYYYIRLAYAIKIASRPLS